MGRTPRNPPPIETPEANAVVVREELNAADAMSVVAAGYSEERDLMNQLWGQIQMADAVSKLTTVVSLQKLSHIKETKLYRALAGKKAHDQDGNEIADVGTWEGFCRAIGSSRTKVDEDLINLSVFGERALIQLTAVGAGYRELRKLRKLPEDERLLISQATDNESLIGLIDDMAIKHAQEKAELKKQVEESQANYDGQLEVSRKKETLINDQERELAKLRRRLDSQTPDEQGAELRQEVAGLGYAIEGQITVSLMEAFDKLSEHAEANDCTHEEFMSGLLFGIERALLAVRNKHNVKDVPDGDERPDWTRPDFDADAVVKAALAKEAGHA